MWFGMNYPKQIDLRQSFECAMGGAGGKELLYMDVRSLATGKLLATWTLGALKPAEDTHGPTNPGMPEANEDENRGLTGEARAAFIKSAIENAIRDRTQPRRLTAHATPTSWRISSPSKKLWL